MLELELLARRENKPVWLPISPSTSLASLPDLCVRVVGKGIVLAPIMLTSGHVLCVVWHGRNSYKRSARLSQFIIHRGVIISFIQAVFSALFYFAAIGIYNVRLDGLTSALPATDLFGGRYIFRVGSWLDTPPFTQWHRCSRWYWMKTLMKILHSNSPSCIKNSKRSGNGSFGLIWTQNG